MPTASTKRFCLQCEEPIQGRADKKFCDDQCRTAYNNQLKSESAFVRMVNGHLRKNRRILEQLLDASEDGKRKVSSKMMHDFGFHFSYYTHTYITQKGSHYVFCYEYGYLKISDDFYMIVKRHEQ